MHLDLRCFRISTAIPVSKRFTTWRIAVAFLLIGEKFSANFLEMAEFAALIAIAFLLISSTAIRSSWSSLPLRAYFAVGIMFFNGSWVLCLHCRLCGLFMRSISARTRASKLSTVISTYALETVEIRYSDSGSELINIDFFCRLSVAMFCIASSAIRELNLLRRSSQSVLSIYIKCSG